MGDLMPDIIMARPIMGAMPQGEKHTSGPWAKDDPYRNAVRYIRADLVEIPADLKEATDGLA